MGDEGSRVECALIDIVAVKETAAQKISRTSVCALLAEETPSQSKSGSIRVENDECDCECGPNHAGRKVRQNLVN